MTLSTNRHIFWERPANRHEASWSSLLSCQDVLGRGDQGVELLAHSPGGPARRPGRQRLSMGWRQGLEGGRDTPQASPHSAPWLHRRLQAWVPSLTPPRRALWGAAPVWSGTAPLPSRCGGAAARSMRGARGRTRPSCVVRDKAWSASMGAGRRGESYLGCRSVTSSPS